MVAAVWPWVVWGWEWAFWAVSWGWYCFANVGVVAWMIASWWRADEQGEG